MMKRFRATRGFTLLEVIIAVGLFVTAVAVILGLIAGLSRQGAESNEVLSAHQLPGPIKVELSRLASSGLDSLAGRVPVMASPLSDGLAFAASRNADRVDSLAYLPVAHLLPADEQYYLVECWKFPAEPLRFDGQKAFLALYVRVSWPYRLPGGTAPTALADRSQVTFTLSLNR
jgi:hypothetical protein